MGKSFVMKRPDGSLAGYLMQEGDGTVCFRAHALPGEGAHLTLVFQDGRQESRAVSGEREAAWPGGGGAIEAAFVSAIAGGEERLLMCTGERGRQAFETARERTARRRAREALKAKANDRREGERTPRRETGEEPDKEPGGESGEEPEKEPEKESDGKPQEERREALDEAQEKAPGRNEEDDAPRAALSGLEWAERRWPPPPCMPGARYEAGRWRA